VGDQSSVMPTRRRIGSHPNHHTITSRTLNEAPDLDIQLTHGLDLTTAGGHNDQANSVSSLQQHAMPDFSEELAHAELGQDGQKLSHRLRSILSNATFKNKTGGNPTTLQKAWPLSFAKIEPREFPPQFRIETSPRIHPSST